MTATPTDVQVQPKTIQGPPTQALVVAPDVDFLAEVKRVKGQIAAVHQVMREMMKDGVHYGVIPGTEKKDKAGKDISKPVLYQPGADLLCMLFRLRPEYEEVRLVERDDFIAMTIRCRLIHIPTGGIAAEGIGTSNSRESKYAAQTNIKTCPTCNAQTIFASRDGGWFCWKKKGGCGATFKEEDPEIITQDEKPSASAVWNVHNTITKLGNKRAKLSAVMTATGASEVFDIDLDDEAMDPRTAMTAQQWNEIQSAGKRLGISMKEIHDRFVVGLLKKERVGEVTFQDAVLILAEIGKVQPSAKPATVEDATARAKAQREGKSAEAKPAEATPATGNSGTGDQKAESPKEAKPTPPLATADRTVMVARLVQAAKDSAVPIAEIYAKYQVINHQDMKDAQIEDAIAFLADLNR